MSRAIMQAEIDREQERVEAQLERTMDNHTYIIAGLEFSTLRELPADVRLYMAQWANDGCWDIWAAPEYAAYEQELRDFAAAYDVYAQKRYAKRLAMVTDLDAIKAAFLGGDNEGASVRAQIAIAKQLQRIADAMSAQLSIQGVEMEFFEAQDRWKNEREAEENPALEEYRYRKQQAEAWAKAERGE